MADEIEINGSLKYEDTEGSEITIEIAGILFDVSTKKFVHAKVSVGTSEEAIPLGEVTSLGWGFFKNLDDENYLEIRSGTGSGNDIIKVPPLGAAGPFHFGSDISAPYWIANTAACQAEYLIVSQ